MAMTIDIRVAENGRMILPQSVRKAMGLSGKAKVILTLENDEVRLTPVGHGVARARALYRQHVKTDRSTDEFIADRREEVAREEAGVEQASSEETAK